MKRCVLALTTVLFCVVFGLTSTAAQAATWPLVRSGDKGPDVSTVQHLVTARGFATEADGDFGPNTVTQVKAFQRSAGLTDDGMVGPDTWPKLVVEVKAGAKADAIKAAQVQLQKHLLTVTVNGTFDDATAKAVEDFQAEHELAASGVVDAATWNELLGGPIAGLTYALPIPKNTLPRSEYDDPHHDYPALDLPTNSGTPAYAVTGGTVTAIGGSCGIGVQIDGDDGAEYRFCHLSSRSVSSGRIEAGKQYGKTGNTGQSSGPHLHIQIRYGGSLRCPQKMMLAIYDGTTVPTPSQLPTSGCSY